MINHKKLAEARLLLARIKGNVIGLKGILRNSEIPGMILERLDELDRLLNEGLATPEDQQ